MTVIDSGVKHDPNGSKQSQTNEGTFSGTIGEDALSSLCFSRLINCNSGTSRSMGCQQRGKESLKLLSDRLLEM